MTNGSGHTADCKDGCPINHTTTEPQTPATEAGRRHIRIVERVVGHKANAEFIADILAIEAEARAEADKRPSTVSYLQGVADERERLAGAVLDVDVLAKALHRLTKRGDIDLRSYPDADRIAAEYRAILAGAVGREALPIDEPWQCTVSDCEGGHCKHRAAAWAEGSLR